MKAEKILITLIVLLMISMMVFAQDKAFAGKWDIQGNAPHEYAVYWLEVKEVNGAMEAWFLNRGGSVYKLPSIKIENGELSFPINDKPNAPVHRAKVVDGKLQGSVTMGSNTINWTGERAPRWRSFNANASHKFGTPIELFDGKSLDGWQPQVKNKPIGWQVVDGVMTNDPKANNLVSMQKFMDFKIRCEYKLEPKQPGGNSANSGIYLRGRYELQVLDDETAKADGAHSHMALYSRVAPKVQASKPAGEWQVMEAVIVGNRVSVWLNGQQVHDNTLIEGITGGALDARESEPGPVMIQGDHEKVYFRKVTITPIVK